MTKLFTFLGFGSSCAAIVVTLFAMGCSTKPPSNKSAVADKTTEDPWPKLVVQFRRDTDVAATRRTLEQLRIDLSSNSDPQYQPQAMSEDVERALKPLVLLSEQEWREIRSSTFTGFDPHYLAEVLYLRDVVRTLDVDGRPADQKAAAAFEWVCRQVALDPWTTYGNNAKTYMPPFDVTSVLSRGAGSGLERAYVFLGLLQQLGLEGVLIGPPEAANRSWAYRIDPSKTDTAPSGPFWAVGVRMAGDVFLYEPWRGERFPLSLSQLKAKPEAVQAWRDDKVLPLALSAADIAEAIAFYAPPLSALATRWKRLEQEFAKEAPPLRLTLDLPAARAAFADATKLPAPQVWNAAGDPFTPTRVASSTIAKTDGGNAPTAELRDRYRFSMVPQPLFTMPDNVRPRASSGPNDAGDPGIPELYDLLRGRCVAAYDELFLKAPTPRERFQRGQFTETIPVLIEKRKSLTAGMERLRTDRNRGEQLAEWAKAIRDAYTQLLRARDKQATNPSAVLEAQAKVEQLMKNDSTKLEALFDTAFAEAGNAEATYLLACGMHERAEQAHRRYERLVADPRTAGTATRVKESALQEWSEALGWWTRYEPFAATQSLYFLGRAEHAKKLRERAEAKIADLRAR